MHILELFWIHRNTWWPHRIRGFGEILTNLGSDVLREVLFFFFRWSSEITKIKIKKKKKTQKQLQEAGEELLSDESSASDCIKCWHQPRSRIAHACPWCATGAAGRPAIWEGSSARHPALCPRSGNKRAVQSSVNKPNSPQEKVYVVYKPVLLALFATVSLSSYSIPLDI